MHFGQGGILSPEPRDTSVPQLVQTYEPEPGFSPVWIYLLAILIPPFSDINSIGEKKEIIRLGEIFYICHPERSATKSKDLILFVIPSHPIRHS